MGQEEDQVQADPTVRLIESDQNAPEGPTPEKAVVEEATAEKERRESLLPPGQSHAKLYRFGGEVRDVLLDKRHRVLILARILLAVPAPAFLVFSAVQHMQAVDEDTSTSWRWSAASFTQLQAGKMLAIYVGLIALPLWILSLLLAQIEEKRPNSLQGWLTAYHEQRLESFPLGWLMAFCETEELSVSGNKAEVIGRVKECLKTYAAHGTPTLMTESTGAKPKPTTKECLVSLWKYFRGLLTWDPRIWSWPKAFEAALFFCSVFGYAALYATSSGFVLMYLAGTPIAFLIMNMVTKVVRSIIDYQYDQKVAYQTFVSKQAFWLSIHTIFGVCVATYGLSAMSRVVIPRYFDNFFELSLDVSCTDRDAFWTAFEATAANASCPALPNCGYASFEDLCQAVQYTPMARAVGVDVAKVLLFSCVGWLLISLLVFGTGRASPTNGYAHLLSRHMIVAMVLGLAQLVSALYSFMRLLLLVPLLRLPRPAAYFDRTDSMARELPLYFYGPFLFYDFWATIFVHVLIAVALNFDFFKTYASRLRRGDEGQEQKAIDELKTKMKQMKKNEKTGEMECEWSDAAPYFWFLPAQIVLDCKTRSLPPMQKLRDVGHLEKKKIKLIDAFKQAEKEALLAKEKAAAKKAAANAEEALLKAGKEAGVITVLEFLMELKKLRNNHDAAEVNQANREPKEAAAAEVAPEKAAAEKPVEVGLAEGKAAPKKAANGNEMVQIKDILFVSHRWEEPGRPDVNGVQLEAIKEYLNEHPEIKWVWFDYSSMPQKVGSIDTRTPKEKAEFQLMLSAIADLYLTAQVLILLDGSYASRFWTLTEAWCSMQTATEDGLHNSISETEEAVFTGAGVQVGSRCTIKCIHNAAQETTSKGLVDLVATKTPEKMYEILDSPDVNVTNLKDKKAMLPVIQKTNKHVIEGFKNGFKSPPSDSKPASPSPSKSGKQAKNNQVAPSDSNAVTAY